MRVDGRRLWKSIEAINRFGATSEGGVCRLEFSPENKQARDLFVRWCEEAGCTVRVDQFGNIFARRAGRDNDLPAVIAGSHLDTQTSGGRFDGIFGVLAGLEVVRMFNDEGIETEAPIEVAVWTNEEGELFKPMIGSAVWLGMLDLDEALDLEEADGLTIRKGLENMGYLGDMPVNSYPVKAYFEAHIEQGPVLFDNDEVLGVVNCAQKQFWYDLTVTGQEAHAGPTPMASRRDAMDAEMRAGVRAIAEDMGVGLGLSVHSIIDYVPFNETLVDWVREATIETGLPWREMFTGAGHDAVNIAQQIPTTMIFVPCRDGISHNPAEDARPEHLEAGATVLANVMRRAANHVGGL